MRRIAGPLILHVLIYLGPGCRIITAEIETSQLRERTNWAFASMGSFLTWLHCHVSPYLTH